MDLKGQEPWLPSVPRSDVATALQAQSRDAGRGAGGAARRSQLQSLPAPALGGQGSWTGDWKERGSSRGLAGPADEDGRWQRPSVSRKASRRGVRRDAAVLGLVACRTSRH